MKIGGNFERFLKIGVIVLGIIFYSYYGIYKMLFVHFDLVGSDFIRGYFAAKNFISGGILYLMPKNWNPYGYPPIATVFFLPFAYLKANHAVFSWFVINHIIIIISGWMIFKSCSKENRANSAVATIAVMGYSYPLYGNILTGNINIIIFFCTIAAYSFLLHKRESFVPFLLSIATCIKIYPALFIAIFFRNKHYRLIKYFILSLLCLGLISLLIFGVDIHIYYILTLPNMLHFVGILQSMSFVYVIKILFPGLAKTNIFIVNALFGILLLGSWWLRSAKNSLEETSVSTAMVNLFIITVVTVMLFPSSWLYYHALFIFPFYQIIFSWLLDKKRFKCFPCFMILFFLINFWEPITYHLPLTPDGLTTIKTIGENSLNYPILYPFLYSCSFMLNLLFFFWLLLNYEPLLQSFIKEK
ncbi:DUF2029 domain-containing protein [candidate division WS5 bacterium]|uniref:DUF2029 domain-containing protein n=1 Tax=candidate division WS5 bacterium TaxID=2093353 RepID=A0A419DAQ6_9BACT|nr:MAG: DUF2029 domain-containing protein [candidate division WS5 bacterium]